MGLLERAIGAYKEEKKKIKEINEKEAEEFAKKALERLNEIITENDKSSCYGNDNNDIRTISRKDIRTISRKPGCTDFLVDGIHFRVTYSSHGYNDAYVIRICPMCRAEVSMCVLNLKDVGKALSEPHKKYDCDSTLEVNKLNEEGIKILSTEEKLLEILREFIQENSQLE